MTPGDSRILITKAQEALLAQAVAIEEQAARNAGTLGFMARAMVQATMPHKEVAGNEFRRKNGNYSLTMLAPSEVGLPYGSIPRLLLAWVTTEAVQTRSKELVLGETLSDFMRQLDLVPTGGRWGTITRLRSQMERLFSCMVTCSYTDGKGKSIKNVSIAEEAHLWWDPKSPEQAGLWESTLILGEAFYKEILNYPVPIDMRALRALRRSPLALDLYVWLSYRLSYLKDPTEIPWLLLMQQFGSDYGRVDHFKAAFIEALKKVNVVYPAARVEMTPKGLMLKRSKLHIAR